MEERAGQRIKQCKTGPSAACGGGGPVGRGRAFPVYPAGGRYQLAENGERKYCFFKIHLTEEEITDIL